MNTLLMSDIDIIGKRVLIREDFNVPIKNGEISSDARIRAALPTIKLAQKMGAKVILMSHLSRPIEGKIEEQYSVRPIAEYLTQVLGTLVPVIKDWRNGIELNATDVVLLENVRFNLGEKDNADDLSKAYASLCDIFVMDAFGTAHRAHASTHGVAKFATTACAGPLLAMELFSLEQALANPARPLITIVGGSKVSSKLSLLENLADIADQIIVGGGIANTFLAASGKSIGKSLYEKNLIYDAKALMEKTKIPLPIDVITGSTFSENTSATLKNVDNVSPNEMIFDIGPTTSAILSRIIKRAKTILWNGPVGVFEFEQFSQGTRLLSEAIAASDSFSIAGGGDTLAAIDKYHVANDISYISTGGGAFLKYIEGKKLPAIAILESRAASSNYRTSRY